MIKTIRQLSQKEKLFSLFIAGIIALSCALCFAPLLFQCIFFPSLFIAGSIIAWKYFLPSNAPMMETLAREHQKLSTLMQSMSDAILAVNTSNKVLFINKHFKKSFLTQDLEQTEIQKYALSDLFQEFIIHDQFHVCLDGLRPKTKIYALPLLKNNGQKGFYDVKITPLTDISDHVIGAVGVFHEVTERRLAEQMREDFVANVSHEVRTPLTAIKGYVQALYKLQDRNGETGTNFLEKVLNNTERVTQLFKDILDLSVIESNQELFITPIDLHELTQQIIHNVSYGRSSSKEIDITYTSDTDEISADAKMIEQLLTNLVDNAYKYTLTKGKIHISWQKTPDSCFIQLCVKDTGIGIPHEHIPRLFERFYRVDPSRSREMGGTGLGLAIVKHIVHKHHGKVWVESKIGEGSSFYARIPLDLQAQMVTPP